MSILITFSYQSINFKTNKVVEYKSVVFEILTIKNQKYNKIIIHNIVWKGIKYLEINLTK
jgi:hypothetical protein